MTSLAIESSASGRGFSGELITEGKPAYDSARTTFNALIDRRPVAIARCRSAADVAAVLAIAAEHDLRVAVRGGGHNVAGHAMCDGGIVVDLSGLGAVEVDPVACVARAGGGAIWRTFDAACSAHGLAAPGGTFNTTGVCGLTMGGGIGFLIGRHGLACDNLIAAEVVTVDGETITASEEENDDLFWALRGGGGNFGVVTRLDFRLHPVREVVGGFLTYAYDSAPEALRVFRDVAVDAPDDFSSQAFLTWNRETGDRLVTVVVCSTVTDEEPERLRALRAAPGLLTDDVARMRYLALQSALQLPFGLRHYWKGHFVRELPDALIDELWESHGAPPEAPGAVLIESIHGAASRVPDDASAVGFRSAAFNVSALAMWQDPRFDDERIAWARGAASAAAPFSINGGGYVNYMQADEPLERVRAAFGPQTFARLQAVKGRYDPGNVLRFNQNVPPA